MHAALRKVGCVMIGQTDEIAPADRTLYHLRDVTGAVESIPLITASILSKKIAEGIDGLVMDVKCGQAAFMKTRDDARELARSLVTVGTANGVRTEALVTSMDAPLGGAVGNALEVVEALETLKGRGPRDLEELSVLLAAWMVRLGGLAATLDEAEQKVRAALTSGRGLEKFRQIVEQQGGDVRVLDDYQLLPRAPHGVLLRAERSGHVATVQGGQVGRATMLLGAGRERKEHTVDPSVGVIVLAGLGAQVRAGDPLAEVHYRDAGQLEQATALLRGAWQIADAPPTKQPLVLETVGP
jgi:pyrimidine-nucleoside phosphorylase